MTPGYEDFEFDLPGALLANLIKILDKISAVALRTDVVSAIPDVQGVYLLLLDNRPVYVGKTDAGAGLNSRLTRHSRKILNRQNLDPNRVTFKAVRIYVFTATDLESDLIRYYSDGSGLAWNGSGFGSNDPGRDRDTTKNKPENFDYQYPIDIDRQFNTDFAGGLASRVLSELRQNLTYIVRAQNRARHADMTSTFISPLPAPFTARQAIRHIIEGLPPGWQATKLLGYVIIYKENKEYPQSEIIARS